MDQVLAGLEGFDAAYLDDVMIYSETWGDHLRHLEVLFQKIQ